MVVPILLSAVAIASALATMRLQKAYPRQAGSSPFRGRPLVVLSLAITLATAITAAILYIAVLRSS
jgi:hypothetical protein